jgi:hypothetical protein
MAYGKPEKPKMGPREQQLREMREAREMKHTVKPTKSKKPVLVVKKPSGRGR